MGDISQGRGTPLSVRSMVDAVALLGTKLSKSQVDRDYQEGAPKHSARAFLAWRAAYRELGRTADSRIDRPQTSTDIREAAASAPQGAEAGTGEKPSVGSGEAPPEPVDDDAAPATDEHTLAFRRDRASNERIKSERAQLELDQLRGSLTSSRDVADFEFTSKRIIRDRIEMVAPRFSADLHAEMLQAMPEEHRAAFASAMPLHAFERRLNEVLREALSDAANAIDEARRDDDDPDSN